MRRNTWCFRLLSVVALFGLISALLDPISLSINKVYAADITNVNVVISDQSLNAFPVTATVTFTTTVDILPNGLVEINFSRDFNTIPTSVSLPSCNTQEVLIGYARFICISGLSHGNKSLVINGLQNPSIESNHYFSVTTTTLDLITPHEQGAGLAYIGNNSNIVTVDAMVNGVLDLTIYSNRTSSTPTSNCNIGTLKANTVKSCKYYIGGGTNNDAGMIVKVNSGTKFHKITGTNYNFADPSGNVTAGNEGYGFLITDNGAFSANPTFVTSDTAVPNIPVTFYENSTRIDADTNTSDRVEVTHKASASNLTPVGIYNQTLTYLAYAK